MLSEFEVRYFFDTQLGCKPSPMQHADRLMDYFKSLGYKTPHIFVKREDVYGGTYGGTKIRKIKEIMLDFAKGDYTHMITTGNLQSNHARQMAYVCNCLGIPCTVILKNDTPEYQDDNGKNNGNVLLCRMFGAEVIILPDDGDVDSEVKSKLWYWATIGKKPYYSPRGGSVSVGDLAYYRCYDEILNQLGGTHSFDKLKDIFVCAGSGGTHAALSLRCYETKWELHSQSRFVFTNVVGVCNKRSATEQEAVATQCVTNLYQFPECNRLMDPVIRFCLVDTYAKNPKYGTITQETIEVERLAAKYLGFLIDPTYAVKPFLCMMDYIKEGRYSETDAIVFMQTGSPFNIFGYEQHITPMLNTKG